MLFAAPGRADAAAAELRSVYHLAATDESGHDHADAKEAVKAEDDCAGDAPAAAPAPAAEGGNAAPAGEALPADALDDGIINID